MEMYDSMYKGNSRAEIRNSSAHIFIPSSTYSNLSSGIKSYNPSQAEFYMQNSAQKPTQKHDYHLQKDVGAYSMPGVTLKIAIPRTFVSFK